MPKDLPTVTILDRLKQYKEFIAIMVFFIGGFLWIYGFFATKGQLNELQCLTNLNVAMIETRVKKKEFIDEIIKTIDNFFYDKLYTEIKSNFSDIKYREKWKLGHYNYEDNGFYNMGNARR